jgi:hypothetical protein
MALATNPINSPQSPDAGLKAHKALKAHTSPRAAAESLNAAVAGSVLLHEAMWQRADFVVPRVKGCPIPRNSCTRHHPFSVGGCTYGFTLSGVAFAVGIRTLRSSATVGAICRISITPRSR